MPKQATCTYIQSYGAYYTEPQWWQGLRLWLVCTLATSGTPARLYDSVADHWLLRSLLYTVTAMAPEFSLALTVSHPFGAVWTGCIL